MEGGSGGAIAAFTDAGARWEPIARRRTPLHPPETIHSRIAVANFHGERDIL